MMSGGEKRDEHYLIPCSRPKFRPNTNYNGFITSLVQVYSSTLKPNTGTVCEQTSWLLSFHFLHINYLCLEPCVHH